MATEDNIRRLRQPEKNVFEELEEHEREMKDWAERRKGQSRFVPGKTAELNIGNRGYIWARGQRPAKKRSSPSDT
jgi:hypothetical protein